MGKVYTNADLSKPLQKIVEHGPRLLSPAEERAMRELEGIQAGPSVDSLLNDAQGALDSSAPRIPSQMAADWRDAPGTEGRLAVAQKRADSFPGGNEAVPMGLLAAMSMASGVGAPAGWAATAALAGQTGKEFYDHPGVGTAAQLALNALPFAGPASRAFKGGKAVEEAATLGSKVADTVADTGNATGTGIPKNVRGANSRSWGEWNPLGQETPTPPEAVATGTQTPETIPGGQSWDDWRIPAPETPRPPVPGRQVTGTTATPEPVGGKLEWGRWAPTAPEGTKLPQMSVPKIADKVVKEAKVATPKRAPKTSVPESPRGRAYVEQTPASPRMDNTPPADPQAIIDSLTRPESGWSPEPGTYPSRVAGPLPRQGQLPPAFSTRYNKNPLGDKTRLLGASKSPLELIQQRYPDVQELVDVPNPKGGDFWAKALRQMHKLSEFNKGLRNK